AAVAVDVTVARRERIAGRRSVRQPEARRTVREDLRVVFGQLIQNRARTRTGLHGDVPGDVDAVRRAPDAAEVHAVLHPGRTVAERVAGVGQRITVVVAARHVQVLV